MNGKQLYPWAAAVIIAAAYVTSQMVYSSHGRPAPTWEYRSLVLDDASPDEELSRLGREGWELVGVAPAPSAKTRYVFKRGGP